MTEKIEWKEKTAYEFLTKKGVTSIKESYGVATIRKWISEALAEKDAEIERLKEEETILTKFNEMCEESLSPDVIHSWGIVKFWIKKNRHLGAK